MILKEIKLINYRNFTEKNISFCPKLNCLIGTNGTGKTNILEAIHLLSTTRSFRKCSVDVITKVNEIEFNVKLKYQDTVNKEEKLNTLEFQCINQTKKILYNDVLLTKTSECLGKFLSEVFIPTDVFLLQKSPEDRRMVFDLTLSKLSKEYLYSLQRYKKILHDKNTLLNLVTFDDDILNTYNKELISNGFKIMTDRRTLIININKNISKYYNLLNSGKLEGSKVKVTYLNKAKQMFDYDTYFQAMTKFFLENKSKELINKQTLFGPHLDDFQITVDNLNVSKYLSQGQNKMVNLALKFSIIDYVSTVTNKCPPCWGRWLCFGAGEDLL